MTHISGLKSYEATFSLSANSYLTATFFPCACFVNSCHILVFLIPINKHSSSLLAHLEGQRRSRVKVQNDQHGRTFVKTALSKKPFDVWQCIQNVTIFLTHIFGVRRPGTNTMKLTLMRTELWGGRWCFSTFPDSFFKNEALDRLFFLWNFVELNAIALMQLLM